MKKIYSFLLLSLLTIATFAQIQDPVVFEVSFNKISDTEAEIVFDGQIDAGWHVYSTDLGDGGPISATFHVDNISGAKVEKNLFPQGKEISAYDRMFDMQVRYFENKAKFVQKLVLEGGPYQIDGYLEYGSCNDENCLPPTQVEFSFKGESSATNVASANGPAPISEEPVDAIEPAETEAIGNDLWKPVITELQNFGVEEMPTDISLWAIFIAGFLGGLVALFTPCVWPIIPMTVSFFLKRNKNNKAKGKYVIF